MTTPYLIEGAGPSEIAASVVSGRTNTSRTSVAGVRAAVLDAGPACAPRAAHRQAALAANVFEPGSYAWALAEPQDARADEHAKPAEPADVEAAVDSPLGLHGTMRGR